MLSTRVVSFFNVVGENDVLSKTLFTGVSVEEKDSSANSSRSLVADCTCKVFSTNRSNQSKSLISYKDYILLTDEQKLLKCCLIKGSYFCIGDVETPSDINEFKNSTNNIYQLTGIDYYEDGSKLDFFVLYGK